MIEAGNVILTDDIKDKFFVCDLSRCKGACCVEGDLGAPLERDELPAMREIQEAVLPYLSPAGRRSIEAKGPYVLDEEGDFSTPTIGKRECAYAVYDERGILHCAIEQAWQDGRIGFRKPISCHLYPLRLKQYEQFTAVNFDHWHICRPACDKGRALQVPLYRFLQPALERKFGHDWYAGLVKQIEIEEK